MTAAGFSTFWDCSQAKKHREALSVSDDDDDLDFLSRSGVAGISSISSFLKPVFPPLQNM